MKIKQAPCLGRMCGGKVRNIDEKNKTATCTVCDQRVSEYRNEAGVWASESHRYPVRKAPR